MYLARYINAEKAKLEITDVLVEYDVIPYVIDELLQRIDGLPHIHSAHPAQWVRVNKNLSECSNCGNRELWMNATVYDYCPNCGAKMDEEVE